MKVCGIVAEYNPFHLGHRRHFALTREALGEDTALICILSGDFVQRGEPAVLDKHTRAEMAVRCGADLVLELPLPWAMAPAETFARGAVGLLAATGVADALSFGSEGGDLAALEQMAELLLSPALKEPLRAGLSAGLSYADARQRAAEALAGRALPALQQPNNILGIEYLKARKTVAPGLQVLAVERQGAAHDAAGPGLPAQGQTGASAAELRRRLAAGGDAGGLMPVPAQEVLARALENPGLLSPALMETALLSRLRALPAEAFAGLPDLSEGLDRRLLRAVAQAPTLAALLAAAGTKRYPTARLRRLLWAAALGLRREDTAGLPPYLRPLGANQRGRELLARMRTSAALPLLTKPAAAHRLGARAERIFALGAGAADLRALGYRRPDCRAGGADWRAGPRILDGGTERNRAGQTTERRTYG